MNATILLFVTSVLLTGCVGLDPTNEGFAENAAEVTVRTFMGVMTLGISEGVLVEERKQKRLRAFQEANYQRWYDALPDQEKNIEDMKQAHRYQLMGTIMQGRPFPTFQPNPSPSYQPDASPPPYYRPVAPARPATRHCTSRQIGDFSSTDCY